MLMKPLGGLRWTEYETMEIGSFVRRGRRADFEIEMKHEELAADRKSGVVDALYMSSFSS